MTIGALMDEVFAVDSADWQCVIAEQANVLLVIRGTCK
jgi:hypothetical protein